MILPIQLVWIAFVVVLVLILLVLLEIHRINYRRENEEIFGANEFDEKVKAFGLTDKERRTLEKLVRASSFENKDAVLNSSGLFEAAVTNFYDFRDVFTVRDETVAAVESIQKKMDFTASNSLTQVCSTRQFNVGDRIDLYLEEGSVFKHSMIVARNERDWAISYDGSCGPAEYFVEREVLVRWTRPDDAVYSTNLVVRSCIPGRLILPHSSVLDKKQLRRWAREPVEIPVEATFLDGTACGGMLLDLSAGGIMLGLPSDCFSGQQVRLRFDLPSFGEEIVDVEIRRNLGRRNKDYPEYNCLTASFTGAFGWTQERVLQYLFEVNKLKKESENAEKSA